MKSTKLILKLAIIAYTLLRLVQAMIHVTFFYIKYNRILASSTSYSIVVAVCSILLFFGVIYDYPVLLQSWLLWSILQFGLMSFGVFDLRLENDTFFPNSQGINVAISSSKCLRITFLMTTYSMFRFAFQFFKFLR